MTMPTTTTTTGESVLAAPKAVSTTGNITLLPNDGAPTAPDGQSPARPPSAQAPPPAPIKVASNGTLAKPRSGVVMLIDTSAGDLDLQDFPALGTAGEYPVYNIGGGTGHISAADGDTYLGIGSTLSIPPFSYAIRRDFTPKNWSVIMPWSNTDTGASTLPPKIVYIDSTGTTGHIAETASSPIPSPGTGVATVDVYYVPSAASHVPTLPANMTGKSLTVRIFNKSTTITYGGVAPNGSENIEGSNTSYIPPDTTYLGPGGMIAFVSDGAGNWMPA